MVEKHTHNGIDSDQLTGRALVNAPQSAMTTANATVLSTGGGAVLSTSDSSVIDNMRTRINELESKLQALTLIR